MVQSSKHFLNSPVEINYAAFAIERLDYNEKLIKMNFIVTVNSLNEENVKYLFYINICHHSLPIMNIWCSLVVLRIFFKHFFNTRITLK